jgi:hypothetical protein
MRLFSVLQAFLLVLALQQGVPSISAPVAGQTLSGQVSVVGTADAPNFASAELAFAYAADPTGTWFPLARLTQPVQEAILAAWDTTQISDGEYSLRLRVYSQDGTFQDFTVTGLQVRNSAPPATSTSVPATSQPVEVVPASTEESPLVVESAPAPTVTPIPVSPSGPTPAPLPANPAALRVDQINFYLIRGALLALALFIVLGLFLRLRRN